MPPDESPTIVLHSLFQDGSDLSEILNCIESFDQGDPGSHASEDEVLGFMRKSVEGDLRHGVYETKSSGRVHVIGDEERIMAMPDIIFAQGTADLTCTINTCTCQQDHGFDAIDTASTDSSCQGGGEASGDS